jgi:hypothetical protein
MHEQPSQSAERPPHETETRIAAVETAKRPYTQPSLRCYGSVPSITLGRGGSGNDAGSNPSQRRPRNIF